MSIASSLHDIHMAEGEHKPMSRQDHATVDTWADLIWSPSVEPMEGQPGIYVRIAAVTHPVRGGKPITIYQMSADPDRYWLMEGPSFVSKKGTTSPRYFDTVEAACWLYSWLHPEQKEPTNETSSERHKGGFYRLSDDGQSAFYEWP